ncbi:MAG: hypothetical protein ABIV05_02395, partial [Actinomycetota bacterium]
ISQVLRPLVVNPAGAAAILGDVAAVSLPVVERGPTGPFAGAPGPSPSAGAALAPVTSVGDESLVGSVPVSVRLSEVDSSDMSTSQLPTLPTP